MAGQSDLFVVCKSCGSEVSPYITECPYCGNRLRKRAPKLERDEAGAARPKQRRLQTSLPRLRPNEIPGIRGDELRRPYVTIAIVVLSAIGYVLVGIVSTADVAVNGAIPSGEWWRVLTTPFIYDNAWSQVAIVVGIGLYGWLLERRYGPPVVIVLFAIGGVGGAALAAGIDPDPFVLGANGAALGLLAAWAVPVLFARRRHGGNDNDDDEDMLGTYVLGALIAILPLADDSVSAIAGALGLATGIVAGLLLDKVRPRR